MTEHIDTEHILSSLQFRALTDPSSSQDALDLINQASELFILSLKNNIAREEITEYYCQKVIKDTGIDNLAKAWAVYKEKKGVDL